jgi:hypothetical protein
MEDSAVVVIGINTEHNQTATRSTTVAGGSSAAKKANSSGGVLGGSACATIEKMVKPGGRWSAH